MCGKLARCVFGVRNHGSRAIETRDRMGSGAGWAARPQEAARGVLSPIIPTIQVRRNCLRLRDRVRDMVSPGRGREAVRSSSKPSITPT